MRVSDRFGLINKVLLTALTLIPAKKGIVFLTLHHITSSELEWFSNMLDQLALVCDFIEPSEVENINSSLVWMKRNRTQIVLTFDDGFKCQKKLVDECLNPRNLKALFFVPTEFIGLTGEDAFEFTKFNFYPDSEPRKLPNGGYDAMTWNDLHSLVSDGHIIGGHTATHPKLSKISEPELLSEIIDSADLLENKLNTEVCHFAYPFGSLDTVNVAAFEIAKQRFKWGYSNIRGIFNESPSKHFIYRQNVVPGTSIKLVKAAVDGLLDIRYRKQRSAAWLNYGEV